MAAQYGVVPTAEDNDEEPCSCVQRYLLGGAMTAEQRSSMASRQPSQEEQLQQQQVIRIHPESIRQVAYASFWSMCLLAIILSKTMIPPQVIEESDLKDVFGYNSEYKCVVLSLCR
jgi:hypothetical protein